jgi:hypothetical protein
MLWGTTLKMQINVIDNDSYAKNYHAKRKRKISKCGDKQSFKKYLL